MKMFKQNKKKTEKDMRNKQQGMEVLKIEI